jgi:hypothetical protein
VCPNYPQEHLKEMRAALYQIISYGTTPTTDTLDKWFAGGATETAGIAQGRGERYLSWFMGRLETIVGGNGRAIPSVSGLTLADVLIYNAFGETLRESESALSKENSYKAEPYYSSERMTKALAKCPKIAKIVTAVAENANIKKWLSLRGKVKKQMF